MGGRVLHVIEDRVWVDYGIRMLRNGEIQRIFVKYSHVTPIVSIGDQISLETVVGYINREENELEIRVIPLNPDIPCEEISCVWEYIDPPSPPQPYIDPRLAGLEPN